MQSILFFILTLVIGKCIEKGQDGQRYRHFFMELFSFFTSMREDFCSHLVCIVNVTLNEPTHLLIVTLNVSHIEDNQCNNWLSKF